MATCQIRRRQFRGFSFARSRRIGVRVAMEFGIEAEKIISGQKRILGMQSTRINKVMRYLD